MLQQVWGFLAREPIGVRMSDSGGIRYHVTHQIGRFGLAGCEFERRHKRQAIDGAEPHLLAQHTPLSSLPQRKPDVKNFKPQHPTISKAPNFKHHD